MLRGGVIHGRNRPPAAAFTPSRINVQSIMLSRSDNVAA